MTPFRESISEHRIGLRSLDAPAVHHPRERIRVFDHFRIPKPQYLQTLRLQDFLPHTVVFFLADMRFSVQFDHQARNSAVKVRDVWRDWMLTAEAETGKPMASGKPPRKFLGSRRFAAHLTSEGDKSGVGVHGSE